MFAGGLFIGLDHDTGYRIISMRSPRMAPSQPVHREFESAQSPMLLHRLYHVLRACGHMPAGSRSERRNNIAVKIYQCQQKIFEQPFKIDDHFLCMYIPAYNSFAKRVFNCYPQNDGSGFLF